MFELLSCVRIDVDRLGASRSRAKSRRGLVVGVATGQQGLVYEVLWDRGGECGWISADYLIAARLG